MGRRRAQVTAGRTHRLLPAAGALLVGTLLVQIAPTTAAAQSVASARQEADQLSAELEELRDRSAGAIVALEQAEDALGRAVGRSAVLARELDAARALAGGTDLQLQRRVSALYRSGGQLGVWASLLEAQSPADLVARKANVDTVVAIDAMRRDQSAAGASLVEGLEDQARQAASEQIIATGLAEAHTAELTDLMARQQAALDRATQRVRDLIDQERRAAAAAAAAKLAREQAASAAAQLTAAQAAAAATGGTVVVRSGTLAAAGLAGAYAGPVGVCPVGSVHSFTDTWGAPRSGGRTHQGTDVFAPYGSPAYAVVDGVIERWSNGGLGGLAMWLRGDDGTRYYYAHNSANLAPAGSRVQAGQVIAFVGTTGNAATTPPHIHFEAHPSTGGGARNPYAWLAALCGG
jgi:murein DD-endopeptidase MepM/ murein hydrolase activator NlpD